MPEYIEREKAQDGLDNIDWYHINDKGRLVPGGKSEMETYVPFKAVEEMLESIPAADVRPVVRAEFVRCGDGKGVPYMCSHCGRTTPANIVEIWGVNFCPNCGAKMEES